MLPKKKFGVVVIIGLDHDRIRSIINEHDLETINLANFNNDCSGVYVGCRQETDKLLTVVDHEGAIKTIRLRIDIPFHNPLFMEDVSHELRSFLRTLDWSQPSCPIISTLDHNLCTTIDDLISLTTTNIAQPIHWPGVLYKLNTLGVNSAIECGQGFR